jgi:hypothetical protein
MAATGKDPESGKLVTHDYRVEGPVMLMLTTTAIDVDPELLNRCLVLTVDEDPTQTAAIQQAQREGRTLAGMHAKRERVAIERLHQNAQRLLRPLAVVNPYATQLSFAASQTRLRRDHAKYLALIDAVTFLFQHQRTVKTHRFADGEAMQYIEVTPGDIALANKLATAVLARSLDDLPPQTRRFLLSLHAWAVSASEKAGVALERFTFTRRMAREGIDVGQTQAALHLERLAAHEFIVPLRAVGDGLISRYRLAWTPDERSGGVADARALGLVDVAALVSAQASAASASATHTNAPTSMTPTCRDFELPVGVNEQPVRGLSGSTPTGETTEKHHAIIAFPATCREFSISRRGDISPEKITSYRQVVDDGTPNEAAAHADVSADDGASAS